MDKVIKNLRQHHMVLHNHNSIPNFFDGLDEGCSLCESNKQIDDAIKYITDLQAKIDKLEDTIASGTSKFYDREMKIINLQAKIDELRQKLIDQNDDHFMEEEKIKDEFTNIILNLEARLDNITLERVESIVCEKQKEHCEECVGLAKVCPVAKAILALKESDK